MKIICPVCPIGAEEIDDDEVSYKFHMQTMHPGGQLAAISRSRNIPKTDDLPPGINPADLPDAEFMKTIQEMEQLEASKKTPSPLPQPASKPQDSILKASPLFNTPVAEVKKPVLKYVYEGTCDKNHQVATLELDVEQKHFVVAYCSICKIQVESREVENLEISENIKKAIMLKHKMLQASGLESKDSCIVCHKLFKNQRALTMHTWRKHKKGDEKNGSILK